MRLNIQPQNNLCLGNEPLQPCVTPKAEVYDWRRPMRTIPLSQGKVALVDDEDYEVLSKFKWCAQKSGKTWYAARAVGKWPHQKHVLMHRQLLNPPPGLQCDHINGNGLDNRRCNLRVCTSSQNNRNRAALKGSSSEFKGVSWRKRRNKWQAYIKHNGKQHHLGYFHNEIDAGQAYNTAAQEHFGEFARVNSLTELYAENHND